MVPSGWSHRGPVWVLALVLALTVSVYWAGLDGPFLFDDYPNIVRNDALVMDALDLEGLGEAATSSRSGLLRRPIAMISFALNVYFGDGATRGFKLTNLVVHLLNGLLVFALARLLFARFIASGATVLQTEARAATQGTWLALAVAAVWMLHPIQLTSVLYVVQRMTSLSGTFVLLGLIGYVWFRSRLPARPGRALAGMAISLVLGTVLGLSCKENAVTLIPLAGLIELTAFRTDELSASNRRRLIGLFVVLLGLPAVMVIALTAYRPEWITDAYLTRDFSLGERLLTQGRVLWHYLGLMGLPRLSEFGLFRDDFLASRGLGSPPTTLLALVAWLGTVVVLWRVRRTQAVLAFALGWYLIGHAVESSVLALELVFEHRNYVPSVGVFFAAAWYAHRAWVHSGFARPLGVGLIVLVLGAVAALTFVRADIWSDHGRLSAFMVRHHGESSRAVAAEIERMIHQGTPLPKVYARLGTMAALDSRGIGALLEMVKILNGYRAVLASPDRGQALIAPTGEGAVVRAEGASESAPEFGPLPRTPEALGRVEAALIEEIDQRLAHHPIAGGIAHQLLGHQRCVRANIDVCQGHAQITLRWHRTALGNVRIGDQERAKVSFSLARMHFYLGDVAPALAFAREAVQLDPKELGMSLEFVRLLILVERWDEAERTLARVEGTVGGVGAGTQEIATVRAMFERGRARGATAPLDRGEARLQGARH